MNIRMLKHLGVVAALVGSMLSVSVANASIVVGSTVQMSGTGAMQIDGSVTPSSGSVFINPVGNTLSFAGYDLPNPGILPLYSATMANITGGGPFGAVLLALPGVNVVGIEPGPAVIPTFFVLETFSASIVQSFFLGTGTGRIEDGQGNFLSNAAYQISSQSFVPGEINSFSATLTATSVIPLPGAMWIFGSGLLLMTAVMRRKVK